MQEFEVLVAGLRQDIRGQIRPHDPRDLTRAMELARDNEDSMRSARIWKLNEPKHELGVPLCRQRWDHLED